ncbi:T9SS type A sorting domain-containing protein [bacterium]|nr:T9SS type A sorting domain-containing protein [bacterium]
MLLPGFIPRFDSPRTFLLTLLLLGSVWVCSTVPVLAAGTLTITCLDVGQGDATLIESPSGMTLLFDGGDNGKGSGVVVPYLQARGITSLDYMAASHYHADHIGGLDEVYAGIPVTGAVLDRGYSYTTLTYDSYANAVASQRQTWTSGQVIDLGEGVTVTCVALNGNGLEPAPFTNSGKENEYDVCLLVQYGGFDFFVAGDLTGGGLSYDDIESSVAPLSGDVDVYRVSHHGSASSSNANFLQASQAEVAVISVGSNSYGHPAQSVLDRLALYGSYVYQTEAGSGGTLPSTDLKVVGGHVVITTDGIQQYTVSGDAWTIDEPGASPVDVGVPGAAVLAGNYPNPFNPITTIVFELPVQQQVRLQVLDLRGRLVRTLLSGEDQPAGSNRTIWNGCDDAGRQVASGTYFYRLEAGSYRETKRMVLIK